MFPEIPAQLCQFHQVKTVSRYLTRNPKTAAGKALWRLTLTLKDSGKTAFQGALQAWFEQREGFLNERTANEESGSSHYTHKTLRIAYLSLKRNLDYLFTFEAHPELGMRNTTNLLDGRFADLKRKLGCHHGMKRKNKIRFIKDYFSDNRGGSLHFVLYAWNNALTWFFFLPPFHKRSDSVSWFSPETSK